MIVYQAGSCFLGFLGCYEIFLCLKVSWCIYPRMCLPAVQQLKDLVSNDER